jgi:ABC-type dipeptide/oligopeptide/nickel transport system permease subunit
LGSRLAPYDPVRQDFNSVLQPPTLAHPFGTDQFGRDILSRTIHGAAISLPVGFAAVLLAASVGVTLGLLAGYYTGWMRGSIMRFSDVLMAFPHMLLALSIAAMLGRDLRNLTLAVAIAFVPQYIRVVQAAALQTSAAAYVDSARVLGAGDLRILLRHILPNVAGPIVVLAALGMALSILTAASLSFLGLGPAPPTPEWGIMLAEGRNYLADAWWIATFPGLAISTSVLAVNLLGDALRDALDPRFKRL